MAGARAPTRRRPPGAAFDQTHRERTRSATLGQVTVAVEAFRARPLDLTRTQFLAADFLVLAQGR